MRIRFSERSIKSYENASPEIRRAFDRKLDLLQKNFRHPSLRTKKYDEARDIWQARVNKDWRFYFTIEGAAYCVLDITPHPK